MNPVYLIFFAVDPALFASFNAWIKGLNSHTVPSSIPLYSVNHEPQSTLQNGKYYFVLSFYFADPEAKMSQDVLDWVDEPWKAELAAGTVQKLAG